MKAFTFRSFLALTRYKVSFAIAFSACPAIALSRGYFQWSDLYVLSGIWLLASGASALNQYQERGFDARMERTARRPLPALMITPAGTVFTAIALIIAGLLIIAAGKHWIALLLGIFTLLWYNGLYTYLKRLTAFAVIPGALTGAIPVMMGWTAAGGDLANPLVMFLAFFIFIWQVPHFWLLALMHDGDYRNAGFPVLTDTFSPTGMKTVIFSWQVAASLASLLIILFGIVNEQPVIWTIIIMNLILLVFSGYHLFGQKPIKYKVLFLVINLFMFLVFGLIIADNIS